MQHSFTEQVIVEAIDGYEDDIRELFRRAFLLGCPLDWTPVGIDQYEEMSLGWYFQNPNGSCVARINGIVVGYALVGINPRSLARSLNRKALIHTFRMVGIFMSGRMDKKSRKFYWYRLRDTVEIVRSRRLLDARHSPEVHMNIDSLSRNGAVALTLLAAIDQSCRESGHTDWVGEINSMTGRRHRPIERFVGEIIRCVPNHTFSWLANAEVQRLTVRRRLDISP